MKNSKKSQTQNDSKLSEEILVNRYVMNSFKKYVMTQIKMHKEAINNCRKTIDHVPVTSFIERSTNTVVRAEEYVSFLSILLDETDKELVMNIPSVLIVVGEINKLIETLTDRLMSHSYYASTSTSQLYNHLNKLRGEFASEFVIQLKDYRNELLNAMKDDKSFFRVF
jgi:hypothetical protein